MIQYGNIKLEFGTGSIRGQFGGSKGRGALLLKQGEPRKIGPYRDSTSTTESNKVNIADYPVALFFSNTESVDVVIDVLKIVRGIVEGKYDTPSDENKAEIDRLIKS